MTTTADSGAGSLRQAILDANGTPGLDTIAFAIPGSGVHTISPSSALPPIIDPTLLDGYTQPGSSPNADTIGNDAVLLIELSGTNAASADGLSIIGGGSTVQGLVVNRWNLNGIRLATFGSNAVTGNFIGTDPTGTEARGNQFSGVTVVFASSTDNLIAGNVISGNGTGVSTAGPGNQGTRILGNLIGTNAAGTGAVPNANGVVISAGDNLIGDTGASDGNTISGNSGAGIVVDSTNAAGGRIFGNRIGTDATGLAPLPNAHTGISVSNTLDVQIGGPLAGNGNVISGNGDLGMAISTSSGVIIEGNLIGTDATGLAPLGNGVSGAPFGGIYLSDSSNCRIGGPLAANVIAFNEGNGVTVFSFGATAGNTVRYNRIEGNATRPPSAGMGIDVGDDGPTANDPLDSDVGVNGLQNFPLVGSVTPGAVSTDVSGTFRGEPSGLFTLDFYTAPACRPRPQSLLQGAVWIGSADVATDAFGDAAFTVTLPFVVAGDELVTATATDAAGNTSEFSQSLAFRVAPASGPAEGGTEITVRGTDFQDGATVSVGGVPATGALVDSETQVRASTPALAPGGAYDVVVTNPDASSGTVLLGFVADFLDVPPTHIFYAFVTRLVANGVTVGCGSGSYCVDSSITRAQMAVFLLKAKLGVCYAPPAATGTAFADVPAASFAADWIEDLAARGITGGCGSGNYCPGAPVTRAQMAVFLLKTRLGSTYAPPVPTGSVFDDVPLGSFADAWIEELSARGITGGCSANPPLYCPGNPNTRGQMAVFIVKTFSLP